MQLLRNKISSWQAILSSGTASSKHCEADGPPTYALKRKMCLDDRQILKPIVENHSGGGWRMAFILSLVVTVLFILMLVICYAIRRNKTSGQKIAPAPLAGRVTPSSASRTAPPLSSRAAPPPPTGYQAQFPLSNDNIQEETWMV